MGKPQENHKNPRNAQGNPKETHRKTLGKRRGNRRKRIGESQETCMGNPKKSMGKTWEKLHKLGKNSEKLQKSMRKPRNNFEKLRKTRKNYKIIFNVHDSKAPVLPNSDAIKQRLQNLNKAPYQGPHCAIWNRKSKEKQRKLMTNKWHACALPLAQKCRIKLCKRMAQK